MSKIICTLFWYAQQGSFCLSEFEHYSDVLHLLFNGIPLKGSSRFLIDSQHFLHTMGELDTVLMSFFQYCDSTFLMIQLHFHMTLGTHQANAGWLSILFATIYSATCTGFMIFRSIEGTQEVEQSLYSTYSYQLVVVIFLLDFLLAEVRTASLGEIASAI